MKNVIRKITTWMLVFGMTFTPVLTSIDTVMANAGEEKITITVGGEGKDFNKGNLNSETISTVNETKTVNDAAANATSAANAAVQAASSAAQAAAEAKTAADKAVAAATQAATDATNAFNNFSVDAVDKDGNKIVEGTGQTAIDNAVATVTGENGAQAKVGTANSAISAAQTAETNANNAVNDANDAIDTWNALVGVANEDGTYPEGSVNAAIAAANDSKNSATTGTEALIEAANNFLGDENTPDTVKYAEKQARDNYVTNETIQGVKNAVGAAELAYQSADSAAQTALDTINGNLAEALKGLYDEDQAYIADVVTKAASEAKGHAEGYEQDAKKAADNAEGFYNQIKSMSDNDAFDLELATSLVTLTEGEATKAEQAAANAAAAAATAKTAEETAEQNKTNAENAVRAARAALLAAQTVYNAAYGAAEGLANNADADVDDLVTKDTGKIDIANAKIAAAQNALNEYNGYTDENNQFVKGYVQNANDAIDHTNELIAAAQDMIDDLEIGNKTEGPDYDRKAAIANAEAKLKVLKDDDNNVDLQQDALDAIDGANSALAAAKAAVAAAEEALKQAQSDYEATVEESKTAAAYAQTALEKYQTIVGEDPNTVGGLLGEVEEKAAIAATAAGTSKDTLTKMLFGNGTDYETLKNDKESAESRLNGENGLKAQKTSLENTMKTNKKYHSDIDDQREVVKDGVGGWFGWPISGHKITQDEYNQAKKYVEAYDSLNKTGGVNDQINAANQTIKDFNAVENFVYTDENTLVVDLSGLTEKDLNEKLAKIAALLDGVGSVDDLKAYKDAKQGLNDDYGPKGEWNKDYTYSTVDKDTTEYGNKWTNVNLPNVREAKLKYKYGAGWNIFNYGAWNDSDRYAEMKAETRRQCVVVCTDIDKLSTLRATFANEKAELALSEANVAAAAAKAAKDRAATAKTNEATALKKFEDAQKQLEDAKKILYGYTDKDGNAVPGLAVNAYEKAQIGSIKTGDILAPNELEDPYNTNPEDPDNDYVKQYTANIPTAISAETKNSIVKTSRLGKIDFDLLLSYLPTQNEDGTWTFAGESQGNKLEEMLSGLDADEQGLVLGLIETIQTASGNLADALEAYDSAKEDHRLAEEAAERAAGHAKRARYFANAAAALTDANTPGGTGESGSTPTPGTPATSGPVLIPLTGGTTGGRTSVAGVRTPATGEGTGEGTAPADNTVAKNNISTLEETELPGAAEAPSSNLEDNDLPGAQGATEDGMNLWWLWAAIALAIAIGFGIYKYADNKKKAENTIQK